jgi:hypothetical protein
MWRRPARPRCGLTPRCPRRWRLRAAIPITTPFAAAASRPRRRRRAK